VPSSVFITLPYIDENDKGGFARCTCDFTVNGGDTSGDYVVDNCSSDFEVHSEFCPSLDEYGNYLVQDDSMKLFYYDGVEFREFE